MSPKCRQMLNAAHVAACTTTRWRCLPPRPRVPEPMSLHQRWRERPRLRALHLTPRRSDGVVHAIVGRAACQLSASPVRAGEIAPPMCICARPDHTSEVWRCVPQESVRVQAAFSQQNGCEFCREIEPHHHRSDDAGAVLGVVNALRFASTRPVAGPAGIDDASARHAFATTR
jgi:hypothetical protein